MSTRPKPDVPDYIALLENETRIKVAASKAQSVLKPLGKLQKCHCINREQIEADMSRLLFAVTAISAFWLSYMSTSLVYGSGGADHEDLGERAAIIQSAGERQSSTRWENQHKHGWKKYGCFDEMIKDLLLTPMWCKGAWGDPLYPFPSEGDKSGRNVSRTADVAQWWSR